MGVSVLGGCSAGASCGSEAASSCLDKMVGGGLDKGDEKGHGGRRGVLKGT